ARAERGARAVQLDEQDGVVAGGERVGGCARLRVAVNNGGVGDGRQLRRQRDRLHAAAGDIEINGLHAGRRVRVGDGLAQAARAAVVCVRDREAARGTVGTERQIVGIVEGGELPCDRRERARA